MKKIVNFQVDLQRSKVDSGSFTMSAKKQKAPNEEFVKIAEIKENPDCLHDRSSWPFTAEIDGLGCRLMSVKPAKDEKSRTYIFWVRTYLPKILCKVFGESIHIYSE